MGFKGGVKESNLPYSLYRQNRPCYKLCSAYRAYIVYRPVIWDSQEESRELPVPNKGHSSAIPGMIGEIDPYTAFKAK